MAALQITAPPFVKPVEGSPVHLGIITMGLSK